jgi:hypothetical protein
MIAIASQNLMNIQKGRIGLDWYQDGDELWCEFGRCASARPGPGFQLTATAGSFAGWAERSEPTNAFKRVNWCAAQKLRLCPPYDFRGV